MAHRVERIARIIKEEASQVLLQETWDPRIGFITVTEVKLSGDIRHARILVSVMGSDNDKRTTMRGLDATRGYVQRAIARRLKTRTTPHIEFVLDDSIDRSIEFNSILKKIKDERRVDAPDAGGEEQPGPAE